MLKVKNLLSEVITLKTDDLAWSMNQYQRNRQPLTWDLLDVKEPDVVLPYDDDELRNIQMLNKDKQQRMVNILKKLDI